jgi:hypothetical protein
MRWTLDGDDVTGAPRQEVDLGQEPGHDVIAAEVGEPLLQLERRVQPLSPGVPSLALDRGGAREAGVHAVVPRIRTAQAYSER